MPSQPRPCPAQPGPAAGSGPWYSKRHLLRKACMYITVPRESRTQVDNGRCTLATVSSIQYISSLCGVCPGLPGAPCHAGALVYELGLTSKHFISTYAVCCHYLLSSCVRSMVYSTGNEPVFWFVCRSPPPFQAPYPSADTHACTEYQIAYPSAQETS